MFSRFKANFIAGVGALAALTLLTLPGQAEEPRAHELTSNFGPVGPREPILATLGGQHVIAFFVPERGSCAVNAIIWKDAEAAAPYASSRVKVSLRPGEMVQFDEVQKSMNLLCGPEASTLAVVAPPELILTGAIKN
jgi:hypothetical protein